MKRSSRAGTSPTRPATPAGMGPAIRSGNRSKPRSRESESDSASNLISRFPPGATWNRTLAGTSGSDAADRDTITMQTGCWTPWKIRVVTSGWWPSGEQSMTQMSSALRRR